MAALFNCPPLESLDVMVFGPVPSFGKEDDRAWAAVETLAINASRWFYSRHWLPFTMHLLTTALAFIIMHSASAHYIFETLVAGSTVSKGAVRRPRENSPVHNVDSSDVRCNINLNKATETVSVAAGSRVGFILDSTKTIYHAGPAAMYLGKAPGRAADWDGSGKAWFKIAHWGAEFLPKFRFVSLDEREFYTTIPKTVPSGEYLLRIEHIGLHQPGLPEFFVSCAQIRITDGGTGKPDLFSIPGYVTLKDPGLALDIYWPIPTSYTVPGPPPYRGQPDYCNKTESLKVMPLSQ